MGKTPRKAALIPISDTLRRTLLRIRLQRGISAAPELDLQSARDAEKVLRGSIPDPLLAFCIATQTSLGELVSQTRSIATFYEANEQRNWREVTRFNHVAFDDTYSDEGLLCTPLDGSGDIVEFGLRKGDTFQPDFLREGEEPFVSYCRWKFSPPNTKEPIDFESSIDKPKLADFRPRLIAASKVKKTHERLVRHPTFGEGRVVRDIPPDKLEIDFGAKGVRKLLAAIVEPLE